MADIPLLATVEEFAMRHAETLEGRTFLSGEDCTGGEAQAHAALAVQIASLQYDYGNGEQKNDRPGGNTPATRASALQQFSAKLRGSSEVPARVTSAKGNATFTLSKNGLSLSFKLNVSSLSNPVAAHLHFGKSDVNGPVVAQLLGPLSPGGGVRNGLLIKGTLRAANLTGSLAGKTIQQLVRAIKRGNIYVNIHTDDGAGGTDTGAGDFASGELRGQVAAILRH